MCCRNPAPDRRHHPRPHLGEAATSETRDCRMSPSDCDRLKMPKIWSDGEVRLCKRSTSRGQLRRRGWRRGGG